MSCASSRLEHLMGCARNYGMLRGSSGDTPFHHHSTLQESVSSRALSERLHEAFCSLCRCAGTGSGCISTPFVPPEAETPNPPATAHIAVLRAAPVTEKCSWSILTLAAIANTKAQAVKPAPSRRGFHTKSVNSTIRHG